MNKYCILNETNLRLKLDNLKKPIAHFDGIYVSDSQNAQIELIEELLSQSIPLIPEITKAYNAGKIHNNLSVAGFDNPQGRYISNLKFDI